jgi:signal peptidase II
LIGLTLCLLGLDQLTKWLVRQNLAVNEAWAPIPALGRFFTITHVRNTGVAFGQLAGFGWIFMLVPLAVLVVVLIYYPRIPERAWSLRIAAALILTGGLGNLIDRLRTAFLYAQDTGSLWAALPYVYVTDFFDIKIWPVWNIADMCVVAGTIILGIWLWRSEQQAPEADTDADVITTDP